MGTLRSLHIITCWSFKCACSPASNCKTGRMLSRMVHPILRVERTAWQIIPTATPLCHTVEHSATTTHGGSMQCASQRASIVPIANHRNERPGEAWVQYHSPRHNDCGLPDAFHCPSSCLGAWGNGMQNCFLHLSPGLSTSTPHYNEH